MVNGVASVEYSDVSIPKGTVWEAEYFAHVGSSRWWAASPSYDDFKYSNANHVDIYLMETGGPVLFHSWRYTDPGGYACV